MTEEFVVTSRIRAVPCSDPTCSTILGELGSMCTDCRRLVAGESGVASSQTADGAEIAIVTIAIETVETGQLELPDEGEAA